jgi:hypothetical protein
MAGNSIFLSGIFELLVVTALGNGQLVGGSPLLPYCRTALCKSMSFSYFYIYFITNKGSEAY